MTSKDFDILVTRIEDNAQRSFVTYKFKVMLLALLGYGYLFFISMLLPLAFVIVLLLINISASALIQFILKLTALILLLTSGYTLLSLWRALLIRFVPPEGVSLTPEQHTPLFNLVDEIHQKINSPKVHQILITDEFNASIYQIPRFGLIGTYKNYLAIGLPLMQALSPEQLRAVIAHEFGHLSKQQGRFASWIFRLRATWFILLSNFIQQANWTTRPFILFFRWYAPFFAAYSFVLARRRELEADALAVIATDERSVATALINVWLKGMLLENNFWPDIINQADTLPTPIENIMGQMQAALQSPVKTSLLQRWLDQALMEKTDSEDTHPSLSNRLTTINFTPELPEPLTTTSANFYLKSAVTELSEVLSKQWQTKVNSSWQERYQEAQESQRLYKTLSTKRDNKMISHDERWKLAELTERFSSDDQALTIYQEILDHKADDAGAIFAMGRINLANDKVDSCDLINRAIEMDVNYSITGYSLMSDFFAEKGDQQEAHKYHKKALEYAAKVPGVLAERSEISEWDRFLPHELPITEVESVCKEIARYPEIAKCYLVRKKVQYSPDKPLYVLGIKKHKRWFKKQHTQNDHNDHNLVQLIANNLKIPGEMAILVLNYQSAEIEDNLNEVSGARLNI